MEQPFAGGVVLRRGRCGLRVRKRFEVIAGAVIVARMRGRRIVVVLMMECCSGCNLMVLGEHVLRNWAHAVGLVVALVKLLAGKTCYSAGVEAEIVEVAVDLIVAVVEHVVARAVGIAVIAESHETCLEIVHQTSREMQVN